LPRLHFATVPAETLRLEFYHIWWFENKHPHHIEGLQQIVHRHEQS
jgi:hypothetical protein